MARDFGTVDQLLPPGISDVRDLPYTVFAAVRSALVYLSFDELPKDEVPPRRIWTDGERLAEWFDEVRRAREAKYGGGSSDWNRDIEDPVQNEAASALISDG